MPQSSWKNESGRAGSWLPWAAAAFSAVLLELPFPFAGPLPPWRSVFAWFGLAPLLWAVLSPRTQSQPRPLRRAFLIAYLCGFLWYMGNCYWIYNTMLMYGSMPRIAAALMLTGFSVVLGLYFGLFGLGIALVRCATGSARLALGFAPFLWAALELAAARITSVPWDQLGYSQVDNGLVNQLAPWTGVYGISFLLVAVNALLAGSFIFRGTSAGGSLARDSSGSFSSRWAWLACGAVLLVTGFTGVFAGKPNPPTTATAVLVQPNLDVSVDNSWAAPGEWDRHIAEFTRFASNPCTGYIAGTPQTGAPAVQPPCPSGSVAGLAHPDLVAWPESPSPFFEEDARLQHTLATLAHTTQSPLVIGSLAANYSPDQNLWLDYNAALVYAADGTPLGRYDKIHLVPFGEYVPFDRLLFFAHKLTGKVSKFTPGDERKVFRLNGHRYGVFICYESVFADEVRQFSRLGAEVLVNISDDGWYGDTSAPWQHFNMARMRAIENRRWILRDTNTGITSVIDPYGTVRQSIPRHEVGALAARYGFRNDVTFYTAHGDVFAWMCVFVSLLIIVWLRLQVRR